MYLLYFERKKWKDTNILILFVTAIFETVKHGEGLNNGRHGVFKISNNFGVPGADTGSSKIVAGHPNGIATLGQHHTYKLDNGINQYQKGGTGNFLQPRFLPFEDGTKGGGYRKDNHLRQLLLGKVATIQNWDDNPEKAYPIQHDFSSSLKPQMVNSDRGEELQNGYNLAAFDDRALYSLQEDLDQKRLYQNNRRSNFLPKREKSHQNLNPRANFLEEWEGKTEKLDAYVLRGRKGFPKPRHNRFKKVLGFLPEWEKRAKSLNPSLFSGSADFLQMQETGPENSYPYVLISSENFRHKIENSPQNLNNTVLKRHAIFLPKWKKKTEFLTPPYLRQLGGDSSERLKPGNREHIIVGNRRISYTNAINTGGHVNKTRREVEGNKRYYKNDPRRSNTVLEESFLFQRQRDKNFLKDRQRDFPRLFEMYGIYNRVWNPLQQQRIVRENFRNKNKFLKNLKFIENRNKRKLLETNIRGGPFVSESFSDSPCGDCNCKDKQCLGKLGKRSPNYNWNGLLPISPITGLSGRAVFQVQGDKVNTKDLEWDLSALSPILGVRDRRRSPSQEEKIVGEDKRNEDNVFNLKFLEDMYKRKLFKTCIPGLGLCSIGFYDNPCGDWNCNETGYWNIMGKNPISYRNDPGRYIKSDRQFPKYLKVDLPGFIEIRGIQDRRRFPSHEEKIVGEHKSKRENVLNLKFLEDMYKRKLFKTIIPSGRIRYIGFPDNSCGDWNCNKTGYWNIKRKNPNKYRKAPGREFFKWKGDRQFPKDLEIEFPRLIVTPGIQDGRWFPYQEQSTRNKHKRNYGNCGDCNCDDIKCQKKQSKRSSMYWNAPNNAGYGEQRPIKLEKNIRHNLDGPITFSSVIDGPRRGLSQWQGERQFPKDSERHFPTAVGIYDLQDRRWPPSQELRTRSEHKRNDNPCGDCNCNDNRCLRRKYGKRSTRYKNAPNNAGYHTHPLLVFREELFPNISESE